MTMVTTNAIVAATGFGNLERNSIAVVAGYWKASSAATVRIHEARLYIVATNRCGSP